MKTRLLVVAAILLITAISNAGEVMLCQQQELKINKKSITSKKMDGGKQVFLLDGKVVTPVEATKALMESVK